MTGVEFLKTVAMIISLVAVIVIFKRGARGVGGIAERQSHIYAQRTSPDADVRAKCMIKQDFYEEPGVAEIRNGTLTIIGVAFAEIQIPLSRSNWSAS